MLKILATLETLWVDFSDSGMPLIINLLYVNEPRQRKFMFTSDYYITAIQLQTLLNCCTNEVSIMYFNTIKKGDFNPNGTNNKNQKRITVLFSLQLFTCQVHMTAVCQYCSLRGTFHWQQNL